MLASARLAALVVIALVVSSVIPLANAWQATERLPPTYLPALEGPRARAAFDANRIPDLQRLQPGDVIIGDSMAGTRIDERRLSELAHTPIAPLLQPGSGSAFWYLALKNWVIASGVKPRMVLIFFRDTNLTDLMFRLDEQYRWSLDLAARDREDELNAVIATRLGPFNRVHRLLDGVLGIQQARLRAEPAIAALPASLLIASPRRRAEFLSQMNDRLGLDHLRPMEAADVQADERQDLNFRRDVDRSVLPLMLRDASRNGLTLCFVRVQRRPTAHRPPPQSPALRRYVDALRSYLSERGALFHDDTGDPLLTLDLYADGDHLSRQARQLYTENLYNRLRAHFQ
jgi:hypothetical protein